MFAPCISYPRLHSSPRKRRMEMLGGWIKKKERNYKKLMIVKSSKK